MVFPISAVCVTLLRSAIKEERTTHWMTFIIYLMISKGRWKQLLLEENFYMLKIAQLKKKNVIVINKMQFKTQLLSLICSWYLF